MKRYTAVWNDELGSGIVFTKLFRFVVPEGEVVMKILAKEGIADSTRYIFKGWPRLQGERVEDVYPGHL